MPRSLSQAGIQSGGIVFAKVEHVYAQPFYIIGARYRESNQFGQSDVTFRLLLRDGVYDENRNLVKQVLLSLTTNGDDQRMELYNAIRKSSEPIGPLMFTRLSSNKPGMNGFIRIDDATPAMLAAQQEIRSLTSRYDDDPAHMDDDDALEDLPF